MNLRIAPAIHGIHDLSIVPNWFIAAMKLGFSVKKHDLFMWQECDQAETAVLIFSNTQLWASGAGWSISYRTEDESDVVLVVETSCADAEFIAMVAAFCQKTNLTFLISGPSWRQPSATFRIEIFPVVVSA
jgi:hypothetical protein